MPLRSDLRSVLVIGSGPIVIGQACEFDYSGTQACRVLRDEGIRVILVNSNPATIMTDPDIADATYVEPITTEVLTAIIDKERPDALLPTLGGQTALNAAMGLVETGVLDDYDVELIGADAAAINAGEDREEFKRIVERCGAEVARSAIARTMAECYEAVEALGGYPVVVRPSFTMGGLGSGIAYDAEDLGRICGQGLAASRTAEVLLEESILGWKEYELELMRDKADNAVVVCSIENIDPVGVHTGDSVTVAPALTLTDREMQRLRDIGIAVIREVGVNTGRKRRCGWYDSVIARYASRVNGFTDLFLTKLDVLTGIGEIPICVAYDVDGVRHDEMPITQSDFHHAVPIYETMPAWDEDISECTTFDELPQKAQDYVRRLEELSGCRISYIGVGPGRDQTIVIHDVMES